MSVHSTITGIKTDIASKLPAILTAAGLANFASYVTGYPMSQDGLSLGVYYAEHTRAARVDFTFALHAHLTGVQEEVGYKYIDAIEKYLQTIFDSEDYGFASSSYKCIMMSNFDNGQVQIYFDVALDESLTDCD